jgi:hypothetical protein
MPEILRVKNAYHPAAVERIGDVVVRDANPWTPTVHALLRHFELVGFNGAPRLVGTGFDETGIRETLTYIHGTFFQPGPWSIEGAASVGRLLREMHSASASFRAPADAVWFPWFGRSLGDTPSVIGHCDLGPWNIVARDGQAVALIDWDRAGPVDPMVELAHACWLNAKLHDDLVAEMEGLPALDVRAAQLRAIVDAYGLPAAQTQGLRRPDDRTGSARCSRRSRSGGYHPNNTSRLTRSAGAVGSGLAHPCSRVAMASSHDAAAGAALKWFRPVLLRCRPSL